ncbi:MAG: hypothetical protein WC859_06245 [Elusimicrobiota bacterium]|jgi:hypothetical protein
MQEKQWHQVLTSLIILGTLVTSGLAQEGTAPAAAAGRSNAAAHSNWNRSNNSRPSYGFLALLDKTVNLSSEQHDAVRGLLAAQRQSMQSLRQETDSKIRALLNQDQQKHFDALLQEQQSRRAARFQRS